ncbi:hypothetical protein [Nocardia wallacei]|nr:hypothetical protein [Nocardia wallacei]
MTGGGIVEFASTPWYGSLFVMLAPWAWAHAAAVMPIWPYPAPEERLQS